VAGKPGSRVSFDMLTLLGVTLAVGVIVVGNMLEGGEVGALMQLTAFMIVAGGTLGAVMVQTPLADFALALQRLRWIVFPPKFPREALMEEVLGWSRTARRDGLLALEKLTAGGTDAFVNKGLGLLVDGFDPDVIRGVLEVQVDNAHVREARAARVYEAMGGYSPTIGILGAVLGLIHVMQNLSDPEELGAGIAVAFVATIYGVGFANLFFLPIANKLKSIAAEQLQYQEMVIDGIVMIADGDNPRAISSKLEGYLQ